MIASFQINKHHFSSYTVLQMSTVRLQELKLEYAVSVQSTT